MNVPENRVYGNSLKIRRSLPPRFLIDPFPLIYAKGAADFGLDHDFNFIRHYVSGTAPNTMHELWNLAHVLDRASGPSLESLMGIMEMGLCLGKDDSTKLLKWFIGSRTSETRLRTWINPASIEKEMAAYIEPWQQLLLKKILERIGLTSQSIGTRLYSLPKQSNLLVDKSWKKW